MPFLKTNMAYFLKSDSKRMDDLDNVELIESSKLQHNRTELIDLNRS